MTFWRDLCWLLAFSGLVSLVLLGWHFILFLCMDEGDD
jgi:hypothetical protein